MKKQSAYHLLKEVKPVMEAYNSIPEDSEALRRVKAAFAKFPKSLSIEREDRVIEKPVFFGNALSEEEMQMEMPMIRFDVAIKSGSMFPIIQKMASLIEPDEKQWMGEFSDPTVSYYEGSVADAAVAFVFSDSDESQFKIYILADRPDTVTEDVEPNMTEPVVESMQPVTRLNQLQVGKVLIDKITNARYDIEAVDMSDPEACVLELVKLTTPNDFGGSGLASTKTIKQNDLRSTRLYIE